MISYNTINVKMPDISHRETTAWVRAVAASYNKRVGEVAYVFCDDDLHRVIIHGILHLVGINDKGPGEREIMEAAENKALALLDQMRHTQD